MLPANQVGPLPPDLNAAGNPAKPFRTAGADLIDVPMRSRCWRADRVSRGI
jgi:hypothetical protein